MAGNNGHKQKHLSHSSVFSTLPHLDRTHHRPPTLGQNYKPGRIQEKHQNQSIENCLKPELYCGVDFVFTNINNLVLPNLSFLGGSLIKPLESRHMLLWRYFGLSSIGTSFERFCRATVLYIYEREWSLKVSNFISCCFEDCKLQ